MGTGERLQGLKDLQTLKAAAVRLALEKTDAYMAVPLQQRTSLTDPMKDPEVTAAFNEYHYAERAFDGVTSPFDYSADEIV